MIDGNSHDRPVLIGLRTDSMPIHIQWVKTE